MRSAPTAFLVGTRWFGVLGPCRKIIAELEGRGYDVFVFGRRDDYWRRYHNGRTRMVRIFMRRSYTSFLRDAADVCKLAAYALYYRPVVIHSFNPKPALLSFIAALFLPRATFIIGVTGLGNTFIRAKRMEGIITRVLRFACRRADYMFFQNPDDREMFASRKLGSPSKYRMFIGPGVDLEEFDYRRRPSKRVEFPVRIVCVSRLLWQKGIREYVEAARRLKARFGSRVRFELIGEFDREHPDCVHAAYVKEAEAEGIINHINWTDRVPEILAESDIFVLHSYREGAPRAILEASAMKIPTVGSDAIGVRELVIDGETGLLTELRSVDALTGALCGLIEDPAKRVALGEQAYLRIAVPYSLTAASKAQLELYSLTDV